MNSKYLTSALLAMSLALISVGSNAATIYNFEGSDNGGTGKATMSFEVDGNTLTVTLNNISPTRLDTDTNEGNAPGISGFGFNLDPDTLNLQSWTLDARDETNPDFVTIGSNTNTSLDWMMGTFLAGVTLEYLPNNDGKADGMLFNPEALNDSAAEALLPRGTNDVFFTTAILTMTFNEPPSLNDTAELSPFVRMQNVGLDSKGSLKLPGTLGNGGGGPGGDPIPEPHTILLMGIGLLGFGATRLRGKANA